MTDIVFVALITGGFTLASGVVGVILSHNYSKSHADADWLDGRRRDVRGLIAQFVHAGTQWASSNEVLVPAYYKAANDTSFWIEWPDTDSGRALRENAMTVERTAGELRLIVSDPPLLEALALAQETMADSTAMGALMEESRRTNGGAWTGDVMMNAFVHFRDVRAAFKAAEASAAVLLRGRL